MLIKSTPQLRSFVVHCNSEPFRSEGFVLASNLVPDFFDVLVEETTAEDFFGALGELTEGNTLQAFVVAAQMLEGFCFAAELGVKRIHELDDQGSLPIELAEGRCEVAFAEVTFLVRV